MRSSRRLVKGYISILIIAVATLSACAQRESYSEDLSKKRHVVEPFQPALPAESDSAITVVIDTNAGKAVTEKVIAQMDTLASIYGKLKVIKGFRVQIYSGQDHKKAQEIAENAKLLLEEELEMKIHPPIEIIYDSPYFRVKIGNFLDKLDAQPTLFIFEQHEDFSDALLVPDKVDIHNLD